MGISNWCNSGSRTIRFGLCYDETDAVNSLSTGLNKLTWKLLWMKLKKEKRKLFEFSAPVQLPYDEYTYSQNFDHGCAWDEPDNLSRSFSVRFADPSRVFQEKSLVY